MDALVKLKKQISSAFKLSGFLISSENCTFLAEQLLHFDSAEQGKFLTTITDNLQNQKLNSATIDREAIEFAINEINRVGLEEGESVFSVINAFHIPRFNYNIQTKKFERDNDARAIIAKPSMKAKYMRERYYMLHQKTMRHELFSPGVMQGGMKADEVKKFKLLYVENLLSASHVEEAVVLGLLTQLTEGKFHIEDPTGFVELDLSSARFHSGFFCEGCFVLAEGRYSNKRLKVQGLGFPPAEPSSSSRAFFGTQNSWGGPSVKLLKYSVRLQEIERTNTEASLVFLSDVRLDISIVMEKLRQLFVGYDSCPPIAIILMGPFALNIANLYELRNMFTALGNLTNGCEQLKKETDLILIPSSEDPTAPNTMPRPAIPQSLTEGLRRIWPRVKCATNPCRLQYCTQQIVVCRMDLMAKFCRNTIHFPETKRMDDHFARTLICQGHLAPIHPIALPINWDFDSSMWLYPLPDLIVVGDSCQSFSVTQHGCTVLNVGSFIKSKYSFKMYVPSSKTVEDSEIPDDLQVE